MPEIVIVDEIGTEAEALACRTIAERGVQLIGTAHGQLLENLIKNPTLSDLVGGICSVTLGARSARRCCFDGGRGGGDRDELGWAEGLSPSPFPRTPSLTLPPSPSTTAGDDEARNRGTQKSVLERKAPPTFPLVIEMRERALWVTHWVEDSVDCLLTGKVPIVQVGMKGGGDWWTGGCRSEVVGPALLNFPGGACGVPRFSVHTALTPPPGRHAPPRPLPAPPPGAAPRRLRQARGGGGVSLRHHW